MHRISLRWTFQLSAFAIVVAQASVQAQFVEELEEVVDKILAHPEVGAGGSMIVGGFLSNPQQDLHAAPLIKSRLIDCLTRKGIKVERRGPHPAISGTYAYVVEKGLEIDIDFELTSRDGQELQVYPARVKFAEDNVHVLDIAAPSSVKLQTNLTGHLRGQAVVAALKAPAAQIVSNAVCANEGVYAVTILGERGSAFHPLAVADEGGFACVRMSLGQIYRILVSNNSAHEAVARVTIDGLDVFTFAKAPSPGYLIPAGGQQEIIGWYVNEHRADSFCVGKFAETPAAEILGAAADAGVICVQFSAAWTAGNKPPDEGGSLGGIGTKRGVPLQQDVKRVPREVGKLREVVSVRYSLIGP